MSLLDALLSADWYDILQWGATLGMLVFAIYEGYTKKGIQGVLQSINDFFQLENTRVTDPPAELAYSSYMMSDETKECISSKIKPEEESMFLAQVKAMEAANNASYVLTFDEWWFKIDFGQISDFDSVKSVTTQEIAE